MTKEYESARAHLSTAIENAAQCTNGDGERRAAVCIATALVLITDELHIANERSKGVAVWRECALACVNQLVLAVREVARRV